MTAQVPTGWCATPENTDPDPTGVYSYSTDPSLLSSFDPVVFNIFFWGINKSDGNPGISSLTEQECLTSVSQLNRVYNDFNIFFKYYGYDNTSFNSDQYYHLTKSEVLGDTTVFDIAAVNGYKKTNSFNVYVASGGADFGGVAQEYNKVNIATHNGFADGFEGMIVHEVGHCFNLFHTHSAWDANYCEHVTRETSSGDYNALDAGDFLHNTAAMPDFLLEHLMELLWDGVPFEQAIQEYIPYKYVDSITFVYNNPEGKDCEETLYNISLVDVKNYMAYNPPSPEAFFEVFTIDQKIRMREAIVDDVYGEFANAETIIASLYEPYKGEYWVSGPAQDPHDAPYFQPGFDYQFISCSCDNQDHLDCDEQPSPFEDTSFQNNHTIILMIHKEETDFNLITHPNHTSIYIDQLSDYSVRRCYDNWNRAALGGSVTKFNDGVFNTNVTITPKDSTGINNQNLIYDLPQGLYKIEKNYDDGTTKERVILKVNN